MKKAVHVISDRLPEPSEIELLRAALDDLVEGSLESRIDALKEPTQQDDSWILEIPDLLEEEELEFSVDQLLLSMEISQALPNRYLIREKLFEEIED